MFSFIKGITDFELGIGVLLFVSYVLLVAVIFKFSNKYKVLSHEFSELKERQATEQKLLSETLSEGKKSQSILSLQF